MQNESEVYFLCPYCGQKISMLVEGLHGAQTYVEDCEVCCNPIQISYEVEDGEVIRLDANRLQ